MLINKLKLENFRNYLSETIEFENGVNILSGKNGQGKTNLLEGVYYLLTGKSYRAQRENELVTWGKNSFHLNGNFILNKTIVNLESHYLEKRKIFKINGVSCSRLSDYVGTVNVIYFSPDDLIMIKGGPVERRRFLDFHIAQMKPSHVKLLNSYNKVINQKRALLKTDVSNSTKYGQIRLWNEQISYFGRQIIKNRWELTEQLRKIAVKLYGKISSSSTNREELDLDYIAIGQKNLDDALNSLPILLEEKIEQEVLRETILVGPHRDDLHISLNRKPARLYASQGQQRSMVLCLKLGQLEIIKTEKGEYPLLLLDDVLSELDNFRREYLVEFVYSSSIQTLITMTNAEKLNNGLDAKFIIDQGKIRRDH